MFQSCVFQNMGFVKLLAPVLRHLRLTELESLIPDEHIAILCHMTGLEVLTIKSPEPRMLGGLMGLPDCIRQLTNLRRLVRMPRPRFSFARLHSLRSVPPLSFR